MLKKCQILGFIEFNEILNFWSSWATSSPIQVQNRAQIAFANPQSYFGFFTLQNNESCGFWPKFRLVLDSSISSQFRCGC